MRIKNLPHRVVLHQLTRFWLAVHAVLVSSYLYEALINEGLQARRGFG